MATIAATEGAARHGHKRLHLDRGLLIQIAAAAVTIILVIGPLLPILYQSVIDRPLYDTGQLFTIAHYRSLASDPAFERVVVNSLLFAAGATLVAQVAGVVLAILVGRTDLPGRRFLGSVAIWPLFLSPLLLSLGWFILYGPAGYITMAIKTAFGLEPWNLYSIAGMSLVAGVSQAPLTLLYCLASAALADPRMEDAARISGAGPGRTLLSVTLPLLRPAILYSAILNFTNSLEMLSIPLIFGEPVNIRFFMSYIYTEAFIGLTPNYGIIGAAAVVLLAIIIALIAIQRKVLGNAQRFTSVSGKASRPRDFALGPLRWPAAILVLLYVGLFVLAPAGAVILRAFVPFLSPFVPFWDMLTVESFLAVYNSSAWRRAVTNTLLVSALAAGIGTFLAAMVAIVVQKSELRGRGLLEYVAMFPRAIPGMIAGIGILYVMLLVPAVGWLRNTILILILAYVGRALPVGLGAISPSLLQISPDLERSARVAGADWWTTAHAILLRLVRPALFSSLALMFISFMKEYSTAVFLVAPGSEVLGVAILQAWTQGNMGGAAALATIQMLLLAVFLLLARRLLGVRLHG